MNRSHTKISPEGRVFSIYGDSCEDIWEVVYREKQYLTGASGEKFFLLSLPERKSFVEHAEFSTQSMLPDMYALPTFEHLPTSI